MPIDENTTPQPENVMQGKDEAKQPLKPATPVEEDISCRGRKRPAADSPTAALNSIAETPPTKRQRIASWLADSGSRVLAHARPLGSRVASEVRGCAMKAAAATGKAAIATGRTVQMYGTKAAVVTGTATKVCATKAATAVKGYAKKAGAVAGHGVKVYGSKAAIAAGNGAKAAGHKVKKCATKATISCCDATMAWSRHAIKSASQRVGRTAGPASVPVKPTRDAAQVEQVVLEEAKQPEIVSDIEQPAPDADLGGQHMEEGPATQKALPEICSDAEISQSTISPADVLGLPEVALDLLSLPAVEPARDEIVADDADAACESEVALEVQEPQEETQDEHNEEVVDAPAGPPSEEHVSETIRHFQEPREETQDEYKEEVVDAPVAPLSGEHGFEANCHFQEPQEEAQDENNKEVVDTLVAPLPEEHVSEAIRHFQKAGNEYQGELEESEEAAEAVTLSESSEAETSEAGLSELADEAFAEEADVLDNLNEPEVHGKNYVQPAMHEWQDPASRLMY